MLAVCSVEQMSALEEKAHDNFLSDGVDYVQFDWIDAEVSEQARELWQKGQLCDRVPLSNRFTISEMELSAQGLFDMAQEVLISKAF